MATLEWHTNDRGNRVAWGGTRYYSITHVRGGGYSVRIDGFPIGKAPTEQAAIAMAQEHNDRR